MKKKRILADILLVAGVLAAALIAFLLIPRGGGSTVVVTVDGEEYASLPLSEDAELLIESEGGTNLLVISDGIDAHCLNLKSLRTGQQDAPRSFGGTTIYNQFHWHSFDLSTAKVSKKQVFSTMKGKINTHLAVICIFFCLKTFL